MAGYMFGCPHCSAKLEARDETKAGRVIACPQCQQQLTIPAAPPMGVLLSSPVKPQSPAPEPSQVQVNSDPGFKRGMSPAKAYDDGAGMPNASSSGFDRLTATGDLDSAPQHTIEAGEDVEGYSFTMPEMGEPAAPVRKKKKKAAEPEPEVEDVHPLEDPKYQLLILIVIVGIIVGGWKWYKSGEVKQKEDLEKEIAAAKKANETPPPPAPPGVLPGAVPGEVPAETPKPAAEVAPAAPGQLPGASPSSLPGATEPVEGETPKSVPAPPVPGTLPGAAPGEKSLENPPPAEKPTE